MVTIVKKEKFEVESNTKESFEMSTGTTKALIVVASVLASIGILLLVILLPLSFSYVEWDEYGLRKDTTSNEVDYSQTYAPGRYNWGVGSRAVTFENTLQFIDFTSNGDGGLNIFTDNGLSIDVECSFQYIIPRDAVANILRQYGYNYVTQIKSVARSSLKNVAPHFVSADYYNNRPAVANAFSEAVAADLSRNIGVQLVFFQLQQVTVSAQLLNKVLQTLVQNQVNLQEAYVQNSTVIRQETNTLVQGITSQITVDRGNTSSQINVINQQASNTAFLQLQEARRDGQKLLFDALGMTSPELQLSFLYVTGLSQSSSASYVVGLQNSQIIVNQ